MKPILRKGSGLLLAVFLILVTAISPVQASGQGRGHGQSKKSQKFINGHDARDDRWDGRGPRPGFIPLEPTAVTVTAMVRGSAAKNIRKAVASTPPAGGS